MTTHDFWSESQSDFSTADMDAIAAAFTTAWTAIKNFIAPACTLKEMVFWDDYNGDGSPGQRDYTKVINVVGSAGQNMLPPQVACSVTELLGPDSRRHWGRFYLPGFSAGCLEPDGTWSPGIVTGIATAFDVCYDAWTTSNYWPIVWVSGPPGFHEAKVEEIRVDNIPDIIRRRRYQNVTQRVTHAVS